MSGFKQANLNLEPKLFLTFDGDNFDPITHDLVGVVRQIMDESGLGNNAILHQDSTTYLGHRLGMLSLVELEPDAQYGCSFGYYGAQPSHPSIWAKSYLEVPHTTSFQFPEMGSYTLSFMYQKDSTENAFRAYTGVSGTLNRPILSKGTAWKIAYIDGAFSSSIQIIHPGGTMNYSVSSDFFGVQNHLVFVWKVIPDVSAGFRGNAILYLNGTEVMRQSYFYPDDFPNTNVASPIFVGGTSDAGGIQMNDRNTSNSVIDQLAVFDFAFTPDQVGYLFRKTRTYERMVLASKPTHYWTFSDPESLVDNTIGATAGSYNGTYYGGPAKVLRRRTGPENIPGSVSVYFQNGGCASVHRVSSSYVPLFNPSGDYTIDFWFNCTNADRAVILSMQSDEAPYNGMLLQINRRNDSYANGSLQFNVTEDYSIISRETNDTGTGPLYYNDGKWHHCALVRRGGQIEMWIDGSLHSSALAPVVTMSSLGPGQLYLMAMMPGKLNATGNLAHLAITSRALQEHEIRARNAYTTIYRVKGTVTLQGVPYRANVRVYRHSDGILLQEILSDPNDGSYNIHLVDNRMIDLLVINMQDRNVRYRAYGPILPSNIEDLPV